MELHLVAEILGIAIAAVLAFGAFYDRTQRQRFKDMERRIDLIASEIKTQQNQCVTHLSHTAGMAQSLKDLMERLKVVERKVDRLLGLNGRDHA